MVRLLLLLLDLMVPVLHSLASDSSRIERKAGKMSEIKNDNFTQLVLPEIGGYAVSCLCSTGELNPGLMASGQNL